MRNMRGHFFLRLGRRNARCSALRQRGDSRDSDGWRRGGEDEVRVKTRWDQASGAEQDGVEPGR